MRPNKRQVGHNKLHLKQPKRLLGQAEHNRERVQQRKQALNPNFYKHRRLVPGQPHRLRLLPEALPAFSGGAQQTQVQHDPSLPGDIN